MRIATEVLEKLRFLGGSERLTRVKELHAQLIVLRGQPAGGGLGPPEHDDEGGGAGYLLAEDDEALPVMAAVTPGELV